MDAGRVVLRPLGVLCAVFLAGNWFAQTGWLDGDILRLEVVPFFRIVDFVGLGSLLGVLAIVAVLGRQMRRMQQIAEHGRGVLEDVAEGVVVVDERRHIVAVNGPMGRLFGHEPAELIGQSLDTVLPRGLPESGQECLGRRKDGGDIHLEVSIRPSPAGSKAAGATLVLRNVTPTRKARETLSTRETYLRLVVEQMPAILWTTDTRLQITSTVGAGLAAVNLQAKDVIGMSMLECLERDRPECTPISAHLKALRGEALSYEMEWKERTFQVRVDPLRNAEKRITGTIGILVDVTERKQAKEAQARLVAVLEATTDVVAMTGPDRRLLYLNRAGRTLLGIGSEEDVSACRLGDFYPPALSRVLDESVARAVGDGTWSGEMALLSRAGTEITVSQVMLAHKSPAGAFEFLSIIARDMRERQRLEGQLRQAQKMEAVGRLAGGIAHDFNNLLCIITGYNTLVAEGLPADEPLRDFVGEVAKAAERATALTQQLLAFSRKQMLVPRPLDLNALLADLEKMLRPLLGEDVELALSLGHDLHRVKADQNQVEQVLMNLAANARDAMPRGGRLRIATANVELDAAALRNNPDVLPGAFVRLEVSDTGCGMDREVMGHLFEPFFTTKGQGKGTGLGLATIFGIVKQSSGHIEVASELGRGTTFRIYLPCWQQEPAIEPGTPAGAAVPPGGVETLLVVEDEDGLRALVCHTLRQRGYHILEASNGEEGMEVSRRHAGRIHLLLSDVVMPKMGGNVLAEHLVAQRADLKVLFMSGFTDSALFRHGIVSGEVECLSKPFTPSALAEKVREVLDRPAPCLVAD